IDETLKDSKEIVNHISLGKHYFIKHWEQKEGTKLCPSVNAHSNFYNIYDIQNLSFSYFISNLVHSVSKRLNDRYWISFPIENPKEVHRDRTVHMI
ncbi:MAG TPA: hypothetical protein ACFYEK_05930, partial [Candidatus Wunengus sp. YC60]|uniref:hypothetical protein n=1 Tax=Candidatus Wunengus sp. YC60 TaxID=3367697 RepID=UPI004024FA16